MKATKIVYRTEESIFSKPRVILGKIMSEDDQFLTFLTGRGNSYRIAKNSILSIEDTNNEFHLDTEQKR